MTQIMRVLRACTIHWWIRQSIILTVPPQRSRSDEPYSQYERVLRPNRQRFTQADKVVRNGGLKKSYNTTVNTYNKSASFLQIKENENSRSKGRTHLGYPVSQFERVKEEDDALFQRKGEAQQTRCKTNWNKVVDEEESRLWPSNQDNILVICLKRWN